MQIYSKVARNQPLQLGDCESSESEDEENLNDTQGRDIKEQELIRERPMSDKENKNRSGSNKKFRICFCGLLTICCMLLFSSGAFYICEAIIDKNKSEYLIYFIA